ncbi:LysR family transcriptional regulator [Burkholderia aenigmatica]|uniref:LysR family transcriptional regulator n=1 Tax=Burkholderia aenigmatica TaxID=2015348 RepID=A0ABY6XS24_9BURK|nr:MULTISPECIES: LysR family transcriptional regulator [Burkholderia]AYQ43620.1 LysR family transcriptional regulator [Burkholderia lata]UKD17143.1 LysR family transcriptional regulator [Burkholderia aenigmatica]VWC65429.1 LysR family transcriptional regulator [Burkholderia aenigmatica]VWC89484.1 LysR family transcriptional regulator [Burkholderia aenigmatica]
MHIRDLDLNLLVVFEALFRERSVTRAAQDIGLTQGAMSHALNRLRTFFEDPLFVKTAEGMMPTAKGDQLGGTISEVIASIREKVVAEAGFNPLTAQRAFVLCMTDMGELVFLPPLIRRLRKIAPHCTLRSVQGPLEQIEGMLSSGEADLALGSIHAAPEGLYQQQLFMHSFVTLVSARNRKIGKTLTRAQFESMPQIVVSLTGRASAAYDSAFDAYGIRRNIFLTTPHFLAVPHLIDAQPDLIATVPLELGKVFSKLGTVRMLPPPVELPPFALRQHWHSRLNTDPANVWLRHLIKETFEDYPNINEQD